MDYRSESIRVDRRDVLRAIGAGTVLNALGVATVSRTAAATNHTVETLYLSDSGGDNGGNFLTKLFSVDLDASSGRANLTELIELSDSDFGYSNAIAASADGATIYLIDWVSRHLGVYDVDTGSFTDEGVIQGLPSDVVLASFSPDGDLFALSNTTNGMYRIDPDTTPPSASLYVTIQGADVAGADIAFDSNGTLYLYVSGRVVGDDGAQSLYTVDYDPSSSTFGEATLVGVTGDFFTGLAVRDNGAGDLVGSNTTRDEIVVIDKTTGAQGASFPLYLGDDRYAYGFGDMTVGALVDDPDEVTCSECTAAGLLTKYEFACVDREDGDCVASDFVLEDGDGSLVTYEPGSFESKEDEDWEPVSATFGTEFCSVWALVKAGPELDVQELTAEAGEVTAANVGRYAISFVAFYCDEAAADAAREAFPSRR